MPKKPIQGTPWYSVLSNPNYSEAFCYIGAHIDEREKLIRDDDDNDDNNSELVSYFVNFLSATSAVGSLSASHQSRFLKRTKLSITEIDLKPVQKTRRHSFKRIP